MAIYGSNALYTINESYSTLDSLINDDMLLKENSMFELFDSIDALYESNIISITEAEEKKGNIFVRVWEGIKKLLNTIVEKIKELFRKIADVVKRLFAKVGSLINDIKSKQNDIKNANPEEVKGLKAKLAEGADEAWAEFLTINSKGESVKESAVLTERFRTYDDKSKTERGSDGAASKLARILKRDVGQILHDIFARDKGGYYLKYDAEVFTANNIRENGIYKLGKVKIDMKPIDKALDFAKKIAEKLEQFGKLEISPYDNSDTGASKIAGDIIELCKSNKIDISDKTKNEDAFGKFVVEVHFDTYIVDPVSNGVASSIAFSKAIYDNQQFNMKDIQNKAEDIKNCINRSVDKMSHNFKNFNKYMMDATNPKVQKDVAPRAEGVRELYRNASQMANIMIGILNDVYNACLGASRIISRQNDLNQRDLQKIRNSIMSKWSYVPGQDDYNSKEVSPEGYKVTKVDHYGNSLDKKNNTSNNKKPEQNNQNGNDNKPKNQNGNDQNKKDGKNQNGDDKNKPKNQNGNDKNKPKDQNGNDKNKPKDQNGNDKNKPRTEVKKDKNGNDVVTKYDSDGNIKTVYIRDPDGKVIKTLMNNK